MGPVKLTSFGTTDSSNETQIWFMNNNAISIRATVVDEHTNKIFVGPPWSIVGAGDFNGDGKADILWHNSSSNETQIWFMNNNAITSRATVVDENTNKIFVGPPWSIVGVDFFTLDRVPDDPNAPH